MLSRRSNYLRDIKDTRQISYIGPANGPVNWKTHTSCKHPALTRLHNNIKGWRADDLDTRSLVKTFVDIPWVWLGKCSGEAFHALHKSTRWDVLQALAKGLRTSDISCFCQKRHKSGYSYIQQSRGYITMHQTAPKNRKEKAEALRRMREWEKWKILGKRGGREEKDSWFSVLWLWHWGPH